VLKLDFNFASIANMAITPGTVLVDTINHNAVCTPGADIIQKAGFEAGDR
jgi:hypothetical protein